MGLRAISLVALTLAVFGGGVAAAEGTKPYNKYRRYARNHRVIYVQPGHGDGERAKPYIQVNPRAWGSGPYSDNLTFWERVQFGQPDYPVR